jgi:hypothetical protein
VYDSMIPHLKDVSCGTHVAMLGSAWVSRSIVTGYLLTVGFLTEGGTFLVHRVRGGCGVDHISSPVGTGALSPRLKHPARELMPHLRVLPRLKMHGCTWPAFFVHNTHFQYRLVFSDYSEDGGSMSARNVGTYMPMYTVSYSRRLESHQDCRKNLIFHMSCSVVNRVDHLYNFCFCV